MGDPSDPRPSSTERVGSSALDRGPSEEMGEGMGEGEATLLGSRSAGTRTPEPAPEAQISSVGRYHVVRRLGAGAMGAVYEARDPDLDRLVALKLVRADLSESARQRMQREALALARLSHPNVVQVYEIGRLGEQTFIAMELVRGRTFHHFQQATPRPSWREALRCYAQAGEGLAAAHAVGLVHRDFKPTNCMLGDDGRVRVVDFGLAKDVADEPEVLPTSSEDDAAASQLTRTGTLLGTPAYMPPEQLGMGPVDAAADQFSFCVALYEALYGERPFVGESLGELLYVVLAGHVQPAPRDAAVPGWVRKVVLRGLAAQPAARWPSMRALLDALADDPAVRRRKWWAIAGVVVVLGGSAWGMTWAVQQDARQCQGAEAKLAGAWDNERRTAVEQAILGTGLRYAPGTWERVQGHLDGYGQAWVASRVEACEATRRGEQSGALLDLRMACLDERRLHLRATVDELVHADAKVVEKAVQAVLELPGLERCEDADALLAEVRPPEDPTVAKRVAELEERLVAVQVKRRAGKYDEGLVLAAAIAAEAEALGYGPLAARAWFHHGILQSDTGALQAAQATLVRAYDAAVAERMTEQAADAAMKSMWITGALLARREEGWSWAAHADPLSRASRKTVVRARYLNIVGNVAQAEGDHTKARDHFERARVLLEEALGPDHLEVAVLLHNLGNTARVQGEHAKARALIERALAIRESVLGSEHPQVAETLGSLGNVARAEGNQAKAREHHERALAIQIEALGPAHLDVARTLHNLGIIASAQGEHRQAREHFERALDIREKALGPKHPDVAVTLGALGNVAQTERDYAAAREYHERALAIQVEVLGPDHPDAARTLGNLGNAAFAEGDHEQSRRHHERALAIKEKALGAGHPNVALTLVNLGTVVAAGGDHAAAREYLERALAIQVEALGPTHPDLARTSTGLGQVLLELAQPAQALPYLERALGLRLGPQVDPLELAGTRFVLARALWSAPVDQGRDRTRAHELARLASTAYAKAGEVPDLTEVDAWLAEHPLH
jgi:eukaryotic-like serine/threonine-protein kinase